MQSIGNNVPPRGTVSCQQDTPHKQFLTQISPSTAEAGMDGSRGGGTKQGM